MRVRLFHFYERKAMSTEIKVKLVSKKHVRQFALDMAKSRVHKFTRVGGEFFIRCEANLKEFIRNEVRRLPSKGKTIL
jgi:hypothetical protein